MFNFLSHHVLKHSRHLKKCCLLGCNLHSSSPMLYITVNNYMSPDWHLISDNKCYKSKNELEVLIDIFDG